MKKIFARRFCQDSNSQPIDHESGSLPTKLSRLIVHGMMLLSFIYNCLQLEIAFCLFFVTSFDGMYYLEWIQNWLKQIPSDEDDLIVKNVFCSSVDPEHLLLICTNINHTILCEKEMRKKYVLFSYFLPNGTWILIMISPRARPRCSTWMTK